MKHAYLIIAHNEFEVLQTLISMLDDERNMLFVHIDKKVKTLPALNAEKAELVVLDKRIDVRWGDISQIKVELLLMETARGCGADYYHIISGTTLPLKSLDEIDAFFVDGAEAYFAPMETSEAEIDLKLKRYNFNTKHFICNNKKAQAFNQMIWHVLIALQKMLGIRRNKDVHFVKASQWCSLSASSVKVLLSKRDEIMKRYHRTFCPDEFFIPSELNQFSARKDYLYTEFCGTSPMSFQISELSRLKESNCVWARKFHQ